MRLMISALAIVGVLGVAAPGRGADKPLLLDVWPGAAPGETGRVGPEAIQPGRPDEKPPTTRITNVSKPTLAIFKPAADKDTGSAVLIAPGGGYNILAYDKEGEEVAAWLNTLGVTGVVLKYRVPRRTTDARDKPPLGPLQDAQRALSLLRHKAPGLGIDPKRIGMLGFSAGGHLTGAAATNFDRRSYAELDEVDKVSCRPDFAILVYPAYLAEANGTLRPDIRVTRETPPSFFAHAGDDRVSPENSVTMYLALKRLGVPSELHVYAAGGHGFGLRPSAQPASTWPKRCEEWLRGQGLLRPAAGK